MSDNATQRLTPKAVFILNKVLLVNEKKKGRNLIIDKALSKEYPLFSEIWERDNKKGAK